QHATAESRAADRRFDRLGKIASALDQGFAAFRFDNEDEIVVIDGAGADHVERSERSQRDAVHRAAQFGEAVQRAIARNVVHTRLLRISHLLRVVRFEWGIASTLKTPPQYRLLNRGRSRFKWVATEAPQTQRSLTREKRSLR